MPFEYVPRADAVGLLYQEEVVLEKIALWWCYIAGATAAVGVYAVIALWAIDQITVAFRVKKQFIEWYWEKCKRDRSQIPAG